MSKARILVTGTGAVCASGRTPATILDAVCAGHSAMAPITQWDTTDWPVRVAAEVPDYNPRELVEDRKLHKLVRRTDLFGLYAAGQALDASGMLAHRATLAPPAATNLSDRSGVYVGSGGGNYCNQYEFLPLLATSGGELTTFGRELANTVNPMWLLRTLPNNVLGHIGIRHGLKGPNACITNHCVGGLLAVIEAAAALRGGEADRALAVGHDTPIEPQMVLYYQRMGLMASAALRPFDARHDGSLFGEGAGALLLETAQAASERGASVLGEILGAGVSCEATGLVSIRADGEGVAQAIEQALAEAGLDVGEVGMVVAHGNGTQASDRSEAAALRRVFGARMPPVTAFKWAFGHAVAAAGILDLVVALGALRAGVVPSIATLDCPDAECADLPLARTRQRPRSDVALVICRGFAGTNTALLARAGLA